jgi:elongation factor 3
MITDSCSINSITHNTHTVLLLALVLQAQETALKLASKRRETDEPEEEVSAAGCTNKTMNYDGLINPKSLKTLSKKDIRKLAKLAEKAEIPLPDYVAAITRSSPEWKWLSDK